MTLATGNPAFSNQAFAGYDQVFGVERTRSTTMTVAGTAGKTSLLLAILSATAIYSWTATSHGELQPIVLPAALIGSLLLALATIFKPTLAPWTAPVYAAFEGVLLGTLSYLIENQLAGRHMGYPGIAMQAVALTIGTLFSMMFLYGTGLIRVTDKLRAGITAATGAICLVYVGSMVLGLFGVQVPFIRTASPIGIGISLVIVGVAAFNLLLDFDSIDKGVRAGAPKSMEWYGAFGLILTLVWLYLEVLRLLQQIQGRDR